MNIQHVMNQYNLHLQTVNKSPQTIRSYKTASTKFLEYQQCKVNGPVELHSIEEADIEAYLYYLQHELDYKPASVNLQLNGIRNFFKFTCKKDLCTSNPAEHIESLKNNAKRRDFLTADEVNQLIDQIEHPIGKIIIRTLAYSGLRISECLALTFEDIDFDKNKIYVRNGKGNKPRTVPLAASLKETLENYLAGSRRFIDSDFIFATAKTGSFSSQYINRLIQAAVKILGWDKHVTAHTLRHSFASMLVKKDVALPTVATLLGHSDFRTVTAVYVHVEDSVLADAVNEIEL